MVFATLLLAAIMAHAEIATADNMVKVARGQKITMVIKARKLELPCYSTPETCERLRQVLTGDFMCRKDQFAPREQTPADL